MFFVFFSAEDNFILIGGQHISRVLLNAYKFRLNNKKIAEADIARPYRYVRATILKDNTPVDILSLAAAMHQRSQRAGQETMFSEIVESMLVKIIAAREANMQRQLKDVKDAKSKREIKEGNWRDSPILMDNDDLFTVLQQMGMRYSDEDSVEEMVR